MSLSFIGGKIYTEDMPRTGSVPGKDKVNYKITGLHTEYFDKSGNKLIPGSGHRRYTLASKFCDSCGIDKEAPGYHQECFDE